MKINLDNKVHGIYIHVIAENVDIMHDIEQRVYKTNEKYEMKCVGRDLRTDDVDQIAQLMEDIIYFRRASYDSTSLIKSLIQRLPEGNLADVLEFVKSVIDSYDKNA